MNSDQLRALQAPLKEQYRSQPDAALITLRALGRLGEESIACNVETGKALVQAGLHPATGGDGSFALEKFASAYTRSSWSWARTPVRASGNGEPCGQLSQALMPAKLLSWGVSWPPSGK